MSWEMGWVLWESLLTLDSQDIQVDSLLDYHRRDLKT